MKSIKNITDQVLLVICDGMGHSDNDVKNAVRDANTPNIDQISKDFPYTTVQPGGPLVGLPKGVAGNSEVGHMNMGAGRPVRQDLVIINEAIEQNSLKDREMFIELIQKTKASNNRLHLMGLLSDGGVHSHIEHIKSILNLLKTEPDIQVYFHAFMDGRDTPKTNGINYIKDLESHGGFKFASMQGRSIGMDRDRRWEKIERCYTMMIGKGEISQLSASDYIQSQYDQDLYDEFTTPALFGSDSKIQAEDSLFFVNFRPDRAKQISETFCSDSFAHFDNPVKPNYFLCMTPYINEDFPEVPILFNKEKIKGTLSEFFASIGKKHLKIAETEKYAHVTYFFNGGEEKPFKGEDRILVNSPKDVETYDLKPEMSAPEVHQKLSESLDDKSYSAYIVNFANPDMVGHTGNYDATVKAIEYIDLVIGKLKEQCLKNGIAMIITADHGNSDQMVYADGSPHTSHSNSMVPFILMHKDLEGQKLESNESVNEDDAEFALKDIAPTMLYLLGINKPKEFTGNSIYK